MNTVLRDYYEQFWWEACLQRQVEALRGHGRNKLRTYIKNLKLCFL